MKGKKRKFTDDEIQYIINNWGKESPHSMKKRFNCSWYAVCKVAEKHGSEIPISNEWTNEDIETLKNEIYDNILSLVCDQRYGLDDMRRMVNVINEYK